MSHETQSPINELRENPNNPELVADMQAALGREWAAEYGNPDNEMNPSAEIILRNPSVYLHEVRPGHLPDDLRKRWEDVLELSDLVAEQAATEQHTWGSATNRVSGLEKIQALVRDGEIKETYRGAVADIMRNSSDVFAESTKYVKGNTQYFAGNVIGAAGWLKKK
jgi:hypothetical protein